MDIVLKQFYDNVKDPQWPPIETYADFIKLPEHIKNECYTQHNFQQVKDQIENGDFRNGVNEWGFQYQNLVYVPVTKCANTYYSQVFTNLGWERKKLSTINLNSVLAFGLLLHPLIRWRKGITEWLSIGGPYYQNDNNWRDRSKLNSKVDVNYIAFTNDLKENNIRHILNSVLIGDYHTQPYTLLFGNNLNQINWIPIDYFSSDLEIKTCIMNFFKIHDYNILLPTDDTRAWDSSADKLKIFNTVTESFLLNTKRQAYLYSIYSEDLKFYHNLLDTFDPTWSSIINNKASQ